MDCGFGLADSAARLERLKLKVSDLAGIVVTHEHSDHIGGVGRLARKHKLPVWLTAGTLSMAQDLDGVMVRVIDSHAAFAVDGLEIHPYPVPHDAREPVQFVFGDGNRRLGVLTDTGCSTPHIEAMLAGVDALVLECNHDLELLKGGAYPERLKERISGRYGHLDNDQAAQLLASIDRQSLQHVVAAHLSQKNNRPDLACAALAGVLNCTPDWVAVASQADGFDWRMLS